VVGGNILVAYVGSHLIDQYVITFISKNNKHIQKQYH